MSRRARARKPYTPTPVHLNAVQRAITGAALLPAAEVASVKTNMALSLLTFGRGIACAQHWISMADALNMAESLAAGRICSDEASRAKIVAGQEALAAVRLSLGRTTSAEEITAVLTLLPPLLAPLLQEDMLTAP